MEQWEEGFARYFAALDPQERLSLMEEVRGADEGLLAWCRRLYQARYRDPKKPGQQVDRWLLRCVSFPVLYNQRRMAARSLRKEVAEAATEFQLDRLDRLTEAERRLLWLEFHNTARRYLSTCSDPRYGSKFLGLRKASEAEKKKRACEDIWKASRGVALASGSEETLRLWCEALRAALLEYDPKSETLYRELDETYSG